MRCAGKHHRWGCKTADLRKYFLILFIGLQAILCAQIIVPYYRFMADDAPCFNTSEIKKRKIKSIVFDMVDKKDFQVAEDRDLSKHYEFDSLGRLTRSYYTVIKKIIQKDFYNAPVYRHHKLISAGGTYSKSIYEFDTLYTNYFYNSKNQMVGKRYNDGSYYNAMYYTYDEKGKLIKLLSCKETNANADKNVFTLGMQKVLFEEKYNYINASANQYKQQYLNDEGRVFKESIVNLNAASQATKISENYVATWINQNTDLTYNDKGQLVEKKYTSNASENIVLDETYEYKNGLLDTEKHYKNASILVETGYVNDSTGLLTSYVSRDYINKSMIIARLLYTYYP